MTPIFSRIWLVKMQQVRAFEISEVSLRNAALIRRACAPTVESPISPSSSCFVTSAATESRTMTSSAFERTKRLDNAQRFLAGTRLRDEQIIHVHAEAPGILRIERVLDVDEGGESAALLRLGDDGQRERRLAGRFRSVNFHDASARKSAHAKRAIDQDVAGGNDFDVDDLLVAEPHDRAVAVIFGDLLDGEIEVFVAGSDKFVFGGFFFSFGGHKRGSLRYDAATIAPSRKARLRRKRLA